MHRSNYKTERGRAIFQFRQIMSEMKLLSSRLESYYDKLILYADWIHDRACTKSARPQKYLEIRPMARLLREIDAYRGKYTLRVYREADALPQVERTEFSLEGSRYVSTLRPGRVLAIRWNREQRRWIAGEMICANVNL